jgi:hypothetical protein
MAEWTGRPRTLNSIPEEAPPPQYAESSHLAPPPEAPGAISSPQQPGETPDDPDLPGRQRGTLPPLASNRRPLTQFGSAQAILRLFSPAPGVKLEAADWEQAPTAFEELRTADPALLTPPRPLGGYGLGIGRTAPAIPAEALAAIGGPAETTTEITATGETVAVDPAAALGGIEAGPAGDVPAGSVRGNGTAVCPDGFPVKGNVQSMIYHPPASRVYEQTIAEFCFATPEAAEAAGYRAPKHL